MHSIEIASNLNNIPKVESLIDRICGDWDLKEDYYGNILIAVTEAVNNAIVHGNHSEQTKSVKVDVTKEGKHVIFSIADQGSGFNFDELSDPTDPSNLEKPDGRGIFLMKNLSDDVSFEANGSKVTITFAMHE